MINIRSEKTLSSAKGELSLRSDDQGCPFINLRSKVVSLFREGRARPIGINVSARIARGKIGAVGLPRNKSRIRRFEWRFRGCIRDESVLCMSGHERSASCLRRIRCNTADDDPLRSMHAFRRVERRHTKAIFN